MSTALDESGQPISGPPYPPSHAGLGGVPSTLPDVPVSGAFLLLFMIFGIAHVVILQKNKARAHKFIFNGPLAAFAFIRVATTSLRIAWAIYPTNVKLAIVASIFVYAGTILMFVINWYFVQRIFRAQHPRLGWSKIYRVIHATGIVGILACLGLLVVGAIQPFFTLNTAVRRIDHYFYLAGQTYFAAFCFAPFIVVLISLLLPRKEVDKFGAGRFRNNISILTAATLILSTGAVFRCVISWLPETPLRDSENRPVRQPWYYSKTCFYCFNFVPELLVVILYALTRVDLRFHVPDGCNEPGDYKRKSTYSLALIADDAKLKRQSLRRDSIESNMTIEEYEGSLFDDSRTLANSLRFPSTVLEVDRRSGNWKMKKVSRAPSRQSFIPSNTSMNSSLWDLVHDNPPPMPNAEWFLRDSQSTVVPRESLMTVGTHQKGKSSRRSISPVGSSRTKRSTTMITALDREEVISDTIQRLEGSIDMAQPSLVHTRNQTSKRASHRPSYDPSLNLNFTFGSSSTPSASNAGPGSAYDKHRPTSSFNSDYIKLLNSIDDPRKSSGSFHTARPDLTGQRSSWVEPSPRHHNNRHHRASASSDFTRGRHHNHVRSSSAVLLSHRTPSKIVVVDSTPYEIMQRPRTPLHFPSSSAPSLPGPYMPNSSRAEMEDTQVPWGFDLEPAPKRARSLSESDKGSDGRSSNRVE